jgi:hypothetical protein
VILNQRLSSLHFSEVVEVHDIVSEHMGVVAFLEKANSPKSWSLLLESTTTSVSVRHAHKIRRERVSIMLKFGRGDMKLVFSRLT